MKWRLTCVKEKMAAGIKSRIAGITGASQRAACARYRATYPAFAAKAVVSLASALTLMLNAGQIARYANPVNGPFAASMLSLVGLLLDIAGVLLLGIELFGRQDVTATFDDRQSARAWWAFAIIVAGFVAQLAGGALNILAPD